MLFSDPMRYALRHEGGAVELCGENGSLSLKKFLVPKFLNNAKANIPDYFVCVSESSEDQNFCCVLGHGKHNSRLRLRSASSFPNLVGNGGDISLTSLLGGLDFLIYLGT